MPLLRECLCLAVLAATLGAQSARIHPYTLQQTEAWQGRMAAAEKAVADKAPVDEMLKALEANEAFQQEQAQVLQRHPDFGRFLERHLALRLKLAKLYANIGFLYAKTAGDKKDATLLTQQGGAFARMDQADRTLAAFAKAKGEEDPGHQEMKAYLAQVRRQVDGLAAQLGSAGVSVVPASRTPIDKGVTTYFHQWWEKLDEVDKALAGGGNAAGALRSAQDHQKGWNGWLVKHSEYEKVLARQNAQAAKVTARAAEAEVAEALALVKKGQGEKNLNYFQESGGPAQRIANARREVDALAKLKGPSDPEVLRLSRAVEDAEKQARGAGSALKAEALAARKMPVEAYSGPDKAGIKAQMLAYWKQKYPQDKVLGIRFFETHWKRETNWKSNATSIYKSDYSWLPAKVVVQTSAEVAALYPVFANKQHQQENKMVISDDRGGREYAVDEMLMRNVKF